MRGRGEVGGWARLLAGPCGKKREERRGKAVGWARVGAELGPSGRVRRFPIFLFLEL